MKWTITVVVCFFAGESASCARNESQRDTFTQADGARIKGLLMRHLDARREPPVGVYVSVVAVEISLNRDGSSAGEPTLVKVTPGAQSRTAAESALRAVRRCGPFQLPADKYAFCDEIEAVLAPRMIRNDELPKFP